MKNNIYIYNQKKKKKENKGILLEATVVTQW